MTDDTLGGYRLVRKLGEGARAEVFLAYPSVGDTSSSPVAIKVYRQHVAESSIIAEVEALSRAAGDHVVGLVDLASDSSGKAAVIMNRIPGGSLGRLLRDRSSLRVGEAITLLAPIALTLQRLHAAGVVHGGLRLEAVAFDSAGAPVLTCFGKAELITPLLPPALLEAESGVGNDIRAFERLAGAVLDRLPHPVELPEVAASDWLSSVASRLFGLGQSEPIQLRPDEAPTLPPARLITADPVAGAIESRASSTVLSLGLPEWLDLDGLRQRVRGVRRPVWLAFAGVAVAVVVALVAIPRGSTDATANPEPTPDPAAPNAAELASPVHGDDPVAALPLLLESRAGCIRDLSVLCLDDVAHAGSAALAADQQLVRDLQQGAESPVELLAVSAKDLTLEERMGDAALISLGDVSDSEPASVLLMKTEAGWRIRDYLER